MTVKLKEGIYWVGAVDWNIRDMHGYNTPEGATYNAYLIVDEKIALVDTVKHGFEDELLKRIREIINPGDIDYVIANHLEMDHSSALPEVMSEANNAEIISSEKCREGLLRVYKNAREWNIKTVKTGDTLNLGRKTLAFFSAPMLHWPDSMFTYIIEDKILMPNDAFGQHIATSQRFDDEVGGFEKIRDDAAKYYANILMPFAPLILRKIDEVVKAKLVIDMIAPSHGIIWRSEPEKIINAYIEWSLFKSKDKAVIFYDTMWHSTEKIAKEIAEGLISQGIEVKLMKLRENHRSDIVAEILDAKAVFVGSPTLNNGIFPTVADTLTYIKGLKPGGKIAAAFGSYGWGGGAQEAVEKELKEAGFDVVESDLKFVYVPGEDELEKCRNFGIEIAGKIKLI